MTLYLKIERATKEVLRQRHADAMERVFDKRAVWLPVTDPAAPDHDPATQVVERALSIPDLSAPDAETVVTVAYAVRAKTAQELARDGNRALVALGADAAVVLTELAQVLVDKGVIAVSDFPPAVRQRFQDIKAIADRVKG